MRLVHRAALAAALVFIAGCGSTHATVEGVVTLDGVAVPEGQVSFLAADGMVVTANINPDGTYRAEQVPVGPMKVTVTNAPIATAADGEVIKNQGKGGGAPAPPKEKPAGPKVVFPSRYASPETSGLSCEVKGAATKFDVPLTK
jgi:hypothetical protein